MLRYLTQRRSRCTGTGCHRRELHGKKESGPHGGQQRGRAQHGTQLHVLRELRELHGLLRDCGDREPGRGRELREREQGRELREREQGRELREPGGESEYREPGGQQADHDQVEEPHWQLPSGWR